MYCSSRYNPIQVLTDRWGADKRSGKPLDIDLIDASAYLDFEPPKAKRRSPSPCGPGNMCVVCGTDEWMPGKTSKGKVRWRCRQCHRERLKERYERLKKGGRQCVGFG